MRRYFLTAALAISLMGGVIAPKLKADGWDRKTKITIDHPIKIQDTLLPAGSYVIKLADTFGQPIVQIFNAGGNHLIATIIAVRAFQLDPLGETRFQFYEGAREQEPALRYWFYPGETDGLEFQDRRPQVAARSTRTNKNIAATVPRIQGGN